MENMTNLKIEKDVPIPPRKATRKGRKMSDESQLALSMKCGDSVFVQCKKILARIKKAMQSREMGVATRTEENGTRLWRVNKSVSKKPGFPNGKSVQQ
jgi:hypothetical protein